MPLSYRLHGSALDCQVYSVLLAYVLPTHYEHFARTVDCSAEGENVMIVDGHSESLRSCACFFVHLHHGQRG